MLALVPYLRERDGISVDQVAQDFAVKPAQIVKDLKVLWFCGLPDSVSGDMIDIDMEALDGEGVVKLANADYLSRPLRLAPHEALALLVALRALRELTAPSDRRAVDRTVGKIEAAVGDVGARAAAVDIHIDPVDPAIRAAVEQAVRDARQLDLTYHTPSRDETTQRVVDPLRLIFSDGYTYLEAWCRRVHDVRLFRLDRMSQARRLETPSAPPEDVERADFSKGLFRPHQDDSVAVLRLRPAARWVADYFPVDGESELESGDLEVTLRYRDEAWLRRLVLRLGGNAAVIEPDALAHQVREHARRALLHYSKGAPPPS
ncbi:MAG: helix-turn-helix transcriptional regulator [Nocardioidaceae bacterium]